MSEQHNTFSSIALGALLPAVVLGIAASAPLVNDQFITPVDGRILTLGWWFMVPLGTALAVMRSRHLWTGIAVGVWSIIAFNLSMVLLAPAADRTGMPGSAATWITALVTVVVPWAIGMVLGWSSVEHRARRLDGAATPGAA